jgi:cyclohexanecarboxyl-CoA dehydrogenase
MGSTGSVLFDEADEEFAAWVRGFAAKYAGQYLERSKNTDFPWDYAAAMGVQGMLGLTVPDENGATSATKLQVGIAHEELAYANFHLAQCAYTGNITSSLLTRALAPEVAAEWVPEILAGQRIVAMGITEPGNGSDAQGMRTRAVKVDGGWRVTGEKTSITFAPHSQAMITISRTEDPATGRPGTTAFLVPLHQDQVQVLPFEEYLWRPFGRASVALNDVFVPDHLVLGEPGRGFAVITGPFDYARVMTCLMAAGMARRALDVTAGYVVERQSFGRPISSYQGVSFPIAENATRLEAGRWLAYHALSLADAGRPHRKEAAMAKWLLLDYSLQTIRDCVIAHGHLGVAEDYILQSLLRDTSGLEIGEGTPQIQKLIIARSILGRDAVG